MTCIGAWAFVAIKGGFTLVDADLVDHVESHSYRVDSHGYVSRMAGGRKDQHKVSLHREILGLDRRTPEVDHINRNPLDNRRCNLRTCTRAENMQNRSGSGNHGSTSRFRGVSWDRREQRWAAYGWNGKKVGLGYFDDEEQAAAVARAWRIEHMPFSEEKS